MHWTRPAKPAVVIVVIDWHADNMEFWICIVRLYKHLCRDDDPSYISLSGRPTVQTMWSKVRRIGVSSKSRRRKSHYSNRNLFRCSIVRTPKIKSQRRLFPFAKEKCQTHQRIWFTTRRLDFTCIVYKNFQILKRRSLVKLTVKERVKCSWARKKVDTRAYSGRQAGRW